MFMPELFEPPPIREISLRPYQEEAIVSMRSALATGARKVIVASPTGSGKCLGKGTPVLMFDGTVKPVELVVAGDKLMGPDSAPRTVVARCSGREMLYRVTPNRGEPYTVNRSHILSLRMTRGTKIASYPDGSIQNLSVSDYLSRSKTFRHCAKGWHAAVDFPSHGQRLPVDPYFLGLWLGDGHSQHTSITTGDVELETYCYSYFASQGLRPEFERNSELSYVVKGLRLGGNENPLRRAMVGLGVIGNKHIPHIYKTASRQSRLALLAGILDADGYLSAGSNFELTLKSELLFDDVAFLARSLGFSLTKRKVKKTCGNNGKVGSYFRANICGDFRPVPFKRRRHQVVYPKPVKDPLLTGISVTEIGEGDYYGFTLDGPDRLFLLGDFTVTHNTEIAMSLIAKSRAKGSTAWFIVDRVTLVDQTSERFFSYGIDHGIIQGDNRMTDYSKPVQIVSAQTLARRSIRNLPDLIIVDEAHAQYKSTLSLMEEAGDARVIGLTATPFTAGMADHWESLVNVTTVNKLIGEGHLAPLKIRACIAPDMKGAKKKFNGEYEEEEAGRRGVKIVGDVVQTWVQQTNAFFGGPVKTIVFSPSVEHGAELCQQFAEAGFNFQQISYLDKSDDDRRDKIKEFRKPNSAIHGLVSCAVLTKGFDVPDVLCGISCRPYTRSFSSHIQEMGRVMRTAPGKEFGLWLDHSGNVVSFADDTAWLYEYGVDSLSSAQKKDSEAREPSEKTKAKHFCGQCGMQIAPTAFSCAACGWERPASSSIQVVQGDLIDLDVSTRSTFQPRSGLRADCLKDPRAVWNAALAYCMSNSRKGEENARRWAYGVWRGIYPNSKLPSGLFDAACRPAEVSSTEWSLIDREIARFRKGSKRRAAA